MRRPAVFLDRDGTINEQMGYVNHISRFVLLPGAAEGIRLLNSHGYLAIVLSNQSGVARGYFPIALIDRVHAHMEDLLTQKGAHIDGIFFCPHYPRGIVPEYSVACDCRKPGAGMVQKACEKFEIDMRNSYVIGDRCSDIEMAVRSHLQGIMVRTGYGLGDIEYVLPQKPFKPLHIAEDLLHAVCWIIEQE